VEVLYGDPLAVWKAWSEDLRGFSIDSGHHMAEENPGALVDALTDYLADLLPDPSSADADTATVRRATA
jgi:haloacetate dehalogenase